MFPRSSKHVLPVAPGSYTNAATASGNIDCRGYDYAIINVDMGTSDDTTNNPSVLKLAESDDTVVTNFADVGTFTGDDTTDGFTIPAAVTSGSSSVQFRVDLRPRKRYLKASVSPVTTQLVCVSAELFNADEAPVGTSEINVDAVVEG